MEAGRTTPHLLDGLGSIRLATTAAEQGEASS